MSRQILLPSLSAGMEEAMLVRWLKKEGDRVKNGDVIAEIETDKATIEFTAINDGIIDSILVPAGTRGVKVNQPIALLIDEGELAIEGDGRLAIGAPASSSEPVHPPKLVPNFTEARVNQLLGFRSQMSHLPSISGHSRSSDSGY
jgi:pyruvate/2-oxoglutarate dehydrogenase complex dihydrolipoamide acyltransferase (E2) component